MNRSIRYDRTLENRVVENTHSSIDRPVDVGSLCTVRKNDDRVLRDVERSADLHDKDSIGIAHSIEREIARDGSEIASAICGRVEHLTVAHRRSKRTVEFDRVG